MAVLNTFGPVILVVWYFGYGFNEVEYFSNALNVFKIIQKREENIKSYKTVRGYFKIIEFLFIIYKSSFETFKSFNFIG